MKKALLAFSLLAAGLASAVTVNWTGASSQELKDVDYSKDITVTYTYTLASQSSSRQNFFWLGFNGSSSYTENNALEFRHAPAFDSNTSNANLISFADSSSSERVSLAGALGSTGTERTLTFVFNVEKQTCTITFQDASMAQQTATLTLKDYPTSNSIWVTTFSPDTLTSSSITVTYSDVPEPTALALVALGVAGVALRRRVA